ncbi:MAG: type II CAAX endopeptidase family protein [Phormidesmis sp.]
MNRPDLPLNPFFNLQSRYLVLGTFLIASFVVGGLYGILESWQILSADDPIASVILTIAILTAITGAILWAGQRQGLELGFLFGVGLPRFPMAYAGILVISLLVFSLGISSVSFYLLSLGFPQHVAQLLEDNSLLIGAESGYPQLYNMLTLLLLLVYAPLVEELIFRGFLLQRWSARWGLTWGIVASSVLFGALHWNNPLGLTLFGLVMGLLYVRSRSLWVPIACHSLNNFGAVGINWLSQLAAGEQTSTVADIQEMWWIGLILVVGSAPVLALFVWRSWPKPMDQIPYLINAEKRFEAVVE